MGVPDESVLVCRGSQWLLTSAESLQSTELLVQREAAQRARAQEFRNKQQEDEAHCAKLAADVAEMKAALESATAWSKQIKQKLV